MDETNPQKVKLKRLKGNAHSLQGDSTERELKKLAIPTRYVLGGYIQYLISGKWWTAPRWTKESGNYLDPLPYTGGYDKLGRRWVNHEGKRREWNSLPFMERLARNQKPWYILTYEERKQILDSMRPAIKYWAKILK